MHILSRGSLYRRLISAMLYEEAFRLASPAARDGFAAKPAKLSERRPTAQQGQSLRGVSGRGVVGSTTTGGLPTRFARAHGGARRTRQQVPVRSAASRAERRPGGQGSARNVDRLGSRPQILESGTVPFIEGTTPPPGLAGEFTRGRRCWHWQHLRQFYGLRHAPGWRRK